MPSRLIGLFRKLMWDDFKGKPTAADLTALRQAAARSNGQTVGMAGIKSDFTINFGGATPGLPRMNGSPGAFTLDDNIVITISFDSMRSWKQIDPLSNLGSQFLLSHEQGHCDLSALVARDCFIEIMQLKAKTNPTEQDGQDEARAVFKKFKDKLDLIQDKYDDETIHDAWVTPSFLPERKSSFQTQWKGFTNQAFTQTRQSGVTAPDGIAYKVPLLDVLAQAGFIF